MVLCYFVVGETCVPKDVASGSVLLQNAQERSACWRDWLGRFKAYDRVRVVVVASYCVVGLGREKVHLFGL
jgi:hypothetical protein